MIDSTSGGLINAALIFATFLFSVPGLLLATNKIWLKIHSWMVVACGTVTLIIGLEIWFQTLRTRQNLQSHWLQESQDRHSLLQQKVGLLPRK